MLDIKIDAKELERARKLLMGIPGGYKRAVTSAMTRTLEQVRTHAVRLTREKYYLKSGDINKTIRKRMSGLAGWIISRGPKKSIRDYYISPKTPGRNRKGGLRAAVKRDGIKHIKAFLIRLGGSGTYYPYVRVGKERWAIKRVMSPAVPQAMGNPDIMSELEDYAGEKFSERLNHEVMRQLGVIAR